MDPSFEQRWRLARKLENAGDVPAAKEIYEALIEEDPHRLYVRIRLSSIATGENNYRLAREHALLCAEEVRTTRWKDLAPVCKLLLNFSERTLVKELITGADWTHPDIVRTSAALSQYLWLIEEVELALAFIEKVEPFILPNALLLNSKATALGYLGKMPEATAAFERCLELDPFEAHVHWALAHHQPAEPPDARIARVRAAQAAYADDAKEQPFLHYALFKEYENAGDHASAWVHLQRGASIKRKRIAGYDPVVEQRGFEVLKEMTGEGFFESRIPGAETGHTPVFVVGMPRSGTTLLERILGGNRQLTTAGELNDFTAALCMESDQFLGGFLRPEAIEKLRGIDFDKVGRHYMERTAHLAKGNPFLSDKNPVNFIYAGFIAKALPHARILCLRRNPMDACLSNLKNLFTNDAYGYSYDLEELADYYVQFDGMCAHWRKVIGGQFLEVSYERLVEDPFEVTREVASFCGLPFDPDAVDITRNKAPVTTASSAQVRQPINRRGIGAWRKYEAQMQPVRDRIEAALGPVA